MCTRSANGVTRRTIIQKQTPSIPETDTNQGSEESIKSIVRKTLLASPDFPKLYADVVISSKPNSKLAKVLAANYKKIVGGNMSSVRTCTHIKVNGIPCGSPALRGEQFCYFHKRLFHGVRVPKSRLLQSALLENEEAIQVSIMHLVNQLLTGNMELKRAEIVLRALNTAVRNARRVRFGLWPNEMVREVPNYEETPDSSLCPETSGALPTEIPAPPVSARTDVARPKPPASVREVTRRESAAVGKT
jgi:hypothetical protein